MANVDKILEVKHISKSFPGVKALDDVSLDVRRGEVLALIGENGAGKSTLIKIMTGAGQPDEGEIVFEGVSYPALTPAKAMEIGIGAVYQEFTLAPTLSVAENIYLGQQVNDGPVRNYALMCQKAQAQIQRLGVTIDPKILVRDLTVAYKQLVEICKALARDAKFLIMDEPTAPLTDDEVALLFGIIHDLKAQGISIIYISHKLDELFEVSDRVTVMCDGKVVTTQNTNEMTKDELIMYMVGRKLSDNFPARPVHYGDVVLEVKNLSGQGVAPISFQLRAGETLGLAGLVGAGRTELARLIFGADPKFGGEVLIDGKVVDIKSPKDAIKHGIGLVCEDRKQQGGLLDMPVRFNITLPILERLSKLTVIDKSEERTVVDKQVKDLSIKTPTVEQLARNLSGGNQQKIVLAKWLASDMRVLILDEPTRGIDVGSKYEIYRLINKLADSGMAVIVISSEMEECLGLTDRMIILHEGEYMTTLEKENYSQELVLKYASGETI